MYPQLIDWKWHKASRPWPPEKEKGLSRTFPFDHWDMEATNETKKLRWL